MLAVLQDTFRKCKGWEAYSRLNFVDSRMAGARASVQRLRMLDNGSVAVSWRLSGSVGPVPVDVGVESVLSLNLLTGQIEKQR